ncbi:Uncharacterised protein [uncultured archaeon]|nr:Uncharacterised protein [uncultured archaeon]
MAENGLYKMGRRSFVKNSAKFGALSLSGIPYSLASQVLSGNASSAGNYNSRVPEGNGIITNIWVERSLFDMLKQHSIKYIFVDIGDVDKKTGKITTPRNQIEVFVNSVASFEKEKNYEFTVLPWNAIIAQEGYNFGSPEFRENYLNEYVQLVKDFGFEGIHVDIEAIPDALKGEYLKMLRKWRAKLPVDSILAAYSGSIISDDVKGNEWNWHEGFLHEVFENGVDVLLPPTYDTDSRTEEDYMRYLQNLMHMLSGQKKGSFMFTIPTHKPAPELSKYALDEFLKAKKKYCNFPISGVVEFASWTIKDENWKEFEEFSNILKSSDYRTDLALKKIACMLGLGD